MAQKSANCKNSMPQIIVNCKSENKQQQKKSKVCGAQITIRQYLLLN